MVSSLATADSKLDSFVQESRIHALVGTSDSTTLLRGGSREKPAAKKFVITCASTRRGEDASRNQDLMMVDERAEVIFSSPARSCGESAVSFQ
jgi:hypothetical protein